MMNDLRLAELLASRWAVSSAAARILQGRLEAVEAGSMALDDSGDDPEADYAAQILEIDGPVATVSIRGVLSKDPMPSRMAGDPATYGEIEEAITRAVENEDVEQVILRIDSPGGRVSGVRELAETIRAAAELKPVVAAVDDYAASAAYDLASQASEIWAPEGARVGSIGVYVLVDDSSKRFEEAGVKRTLISSGGTKGQGAAGVPVSDEFLAEIQEEINEDKDLFVRSVAEGRQMDAEAVDKLATGRMWGAQKALSLGLIDRVGSYRDLRSQLKGADVAQQKPNAAPVEPEPQKTNESEALRLAEQIEQSNRDAYRRVAAAEVTRDLMAVSSGRTPAQMAGVRELATALRFEELAGLSTPIEVNGERTSRYATLLAHLEQLPRVEGLGEEIADEDVDGPERSERHTLTDFELAVAREAGMTEEQAIEIAAKYPLEEVVS